MIYGFKYLADAERVIGRKAISEGVPPGGGVYEIAIFLTGGTGISARVGANVGHATCTIVTLVQPPSGAWTLDAVPYSAGGGDENDHEVANLFSTAIAADTYVVAARVIGGAWVVISEDCGA